jgi:Tfp pilus assembly protein PilZ
LLPVAVEVDGGESALHATAINLGVGGVFVQLQPVPDYGAQVVVVIQLPALNEAARLRGVVRWSNANGFGVQFSSLGARETYALGKLVASVRSRRTPSQPPVPVPA